MAFESELVVLLSGVVETFAALSTESVQVPDPVPFSAGAFGPSESSKSDRGVDVTRGRDVDVGNIVLFGPPSAAAFSVAGSSGGGFTDVFNGSAVVSTASACVTTSVSAKT